MKHFRSLALMLVTTLVADCGVACGAMVFLGQAESNAGYPDSAVLYRHGEAMAVGIVQQSSGRYGLLVPGLTLSPGETASVRLYEADDPVGLIDSVKAVDYYPFVHALPRIRCNGYSTCSADNLWDQSGGYPEYVVCLDSLGVVVAWDSISADPGRGTPTDSVYAMHINLAGPMQPRVRFWFVRDDPGNVDQVYSRTTGELVTQNPRMFGDALPLQGDFTGGDARPITQGDSTRTEIFLDLTSVSKPNDAAVRLLTAPSNVAQNTPFAALASVENIRPWFRTRVPCSLKVVSQAGDTVARFGRCDTLAQCESLATITFAASIPSVGMYKLLTQTYANNDQDPTNDTASTTIQVTLGSLPGWNLYDSMPTLPSGKRCKAGTDICIDDNGTIHATKGGSKLREYYTFNSARGWVLGTPLPAGVKGFTKSGASLVYAEGRVYYKESYGPGFWYKDTSPAAPWVELAGFSRENKVVKGGTNLAYVPASRSIVMTAGGLKSLDRRPLLAWYSIAGNSWATESLPPTATTETKFSEGAAVTWASSAAYLTPGKGMDLCRGNFGSWLKVSTVPASRGRFKGDIAFLDGNVYAAEGNNAQTFSSYYTGSGAWTTLQPWPLGGARHTKKTKYPVLATYGGVILALSGNGTSELYMYVPPAMDDGTTKPTRDGVMAGAAMLPIGQMSISPNLLSGSSILRLTTGPLDHAATLLVCDALGRPVPTRTLSCSATGQFSVDLRELPVGIYLAKLTAGGQTLTRKFTIER